MISCTTRTFSHMLLSIFPHRAPYPEQCLTYVCIQGTSMRWRRKRSNSVIRLNPWITAFMSSWQAQVEDVLWDRDLDTQNWRLVRVRPVLQKKNYDTHEWQICGDLKLLPILLGQQSGFTKHPCYLCLWDSRDRTNHYKKKEWPTRSSFALGTRNIIYESLVNPSKILIPPLHIKLGFMKQFVKALDKTGQCFQHLVNKFPKLSEAKLKEGVFDV